MFEIEKSSRLFGRSFNKAIKICTVFRRLIFGHTIYWFSYDIHKAGVSFIITLIV